MNLISFDYVFGDKNLIRLTLNCVLRLMCWRLWPQVLPVPPPVWICPKAFDLLFASERHHVPRDWQLVESFVAGQARCQNPKEGRTWSILKEEGRREKEKESVCVWEGTHLAMKRLARKNVCKDNLISFFSTGVNRKKNTHTLEPTCCRLKESSTRHNFLAFKPVN